MLYSSALAIACLVSYLLITRALNAVLRNTAVPTVLRAGSKTNVIPSYAEAEIDARTLPGQKLDDVLDELREVLGAHVKLEVLMALDPVEVSPDTALFAQLAKAVSDGGGVSGIQL